jgi:D-arginine dehydrogenase
MNADREYEVIIIGGGIAGASFAYFLTERGIGDVLLVEKEETAGYHATGRSAALSLRFQLDRTVQQLVLGGARFLKDPPPGFCENPLLCPFGVLLIFTGETWPAVPELASIFRGQGVLIELLSPRQATDMVGVLNVDSFAGAAFLPEEGSIDVHELLMSYLRNARRRGAEIRYGCGVSGVLCENGRCRGIVTPGGKVRSRWVVNAAGAWAGRIAELASAAAIELTPLRRCAVTFSPPRGIDPSGWPMVGSEDLKLYFKPEAGDLMMSPMDEVRSEPCDARPDDLTIAQGMERLRMLAPGIVPHALKSRWAGLRTFSPDRVPVVGPDPNLPGFFWHAGQGGTGIETSPELARVSVDLFLDGKTEGIDPKPLSPNRFF